MSEVWGPEQFYDANYNGVLDQAEQFADMDGDGVYDDAERFTDLDGNGVWNPGWVDYVWVAEARQCPYTYMQEVTEYREEIISTPTVVMHEAQSYTDADGNEVYMPAWEEVIYTEETVQVPYTRLEEMTGYSEEIYYVPISLLRDREPFEDSNGNGTLDGAEPFVDSNGNGRWDGAEGFADADGDNEWDAWTLLQEAGYYVAGYDIVWNGQLNYVSGIYGQEPLADTNGNGVWDDAEPLTDDNGNGVWDDAELFVDANGNGLYDAGEPLTESVWNQIPVKGDGSLDVSSYMDGQQGGEIYNPELDSKFAVLEALTQARADVVAANAVVNGYIVKGGDSRENVLAPVN
jgi:hypothetical protein